MKQGQEERVWDVAGLHAMEIGKGERSCNCNAQLGFREEGTHLVADSIFLSLCALSTQ